jgi:hypothetical protein
MTVYVDTMRARYGRMIMCHMAADSEEELHAMAAKIGVARRHYQGDRYDICLAKKKLALAAGAIEVSRMEIGRMVVKRRQRAERHSV